MSTPESTQYLVVYGPPKGTPLVYGTAYLETQKATMVKACMRRHPETTENAVRVVRGVDLDPEGVKGPSTL